MYLYVHQHAPRRVAEKIFMMLYMSCALSLLATFVVAVVSYTSGLKLTFASAGDLKLRDDVHTEIRQMHPELMRALEGCQKTIPIRLAGGRMVLTLGNVKVDNFTAFLVIGTDYLTATHVLIGCAILISWLNKLWFLANIRFLRFRGILVRISTLGVCLEICFIVSVFFLTGYLYPWVTTLDGYIHSCAREKDLYVQTALSPHMILVLNILLGINLFLYVCAAIMYVLDGSKPGYAAYYQRKYDHAHGFLGVPDNQKLRARNDALAHILEVLQRAREAYPGHQRISKDASLSDPRQKDKSEKRPERTIDDHAHSYIVQADVQVSGSGEVEKVPRHGTEIRTIRPGNAHPPSQHQKPHNDDFSETYGEEEEVEEDGMLSIASNRPERRIPTPHAGAAHAHHVRGVDSSYTSDYEYGSTRPQNTGTVYVPPGRSPKRMVSNPNSYHKEHATRHLSYQYHTPLRHDTEKFESVIAKKDASVVAYYVGPDVPGRTEHACISHQSESSHAHE